MNSGKTEDIKFDNLRKSRRTDYHSKIYCIKCVEGGETKEFDKPLELTLFNVSTGGLGILSEGLFETGAMLLLNMELEGESYEKVSSKIIWSIKKGNMYRYGLEITNISGKLFSHLRKLDNSITATV